jgi:hypothetical protein
MVEKIFDKKFFFAVLVGTVLCMNKMNIKCVLCKIKLSLDITTDEVRVLLKNLEKSVNLVS